MGKFKRLLATLLVSAIGIAVMVVIATIVFYITVFVVATGSSLAGLEPDDSFVVLSASLVVVAIILTGGLTPSLSKNDSSDTPEFEDDPAYN